MTPAARLRELARLVEQWRVEAEICQAQAERAGPGTPERDCAIERGRIYLNHADKLESLVRSVGVSRPDEVVSAIADMEFGRSSHLAWADHLEAHVASGEPCAECEAKPYKLTAEHEREWVAKYDRVLKILRSVGVSTQEQEQEQEDTRVDKGIGCSSTGSTAPTHKPKWNIQDLTAQIEAHISDCIKAGKQPSKSDLVWMRTWPSLVADGELHPWYGPCDGLDDGECSECRRITSAPALKETAQNFNADGSIKIYGTPRQTGIPSDQIGTQTQIGPDDRAALVAGFARFCRASDEAGVQRQTGTPMEETPSLLAYMTASSQAKREAAYLRMHAAKIREGHLAMSEIPNTVASTIEDIAAHMEAAEAERDTLKDALAVLNDLPRGFTPSPDDYVRQEQLIAKLQREADTLKDELAEARSIVAGVNNSIFGSHGYFTTPDCVDEIEKLKALSNRRFNAYSTLLRDLRAMGEVRSKTHRGEVSTPPASDPVCKHGTALDVHCCNCHSGFIFDMAHECPDSLADAAEMLWVVLANVSGGDWTQQSQEWQEAAARWRDNYFATLKHEQPADARPRAEVMKNNDDHSRVDK